MRYLAVFLFLIACGESDKPRTYIIQGEELTCTVLDSQECGLTLACEGSGIHQCVGN